MGKTDTNKVIEIGRLTRDPNGENDFGYVANGSARLNISIAVNRTTKRNEEYVDEVSYFDIVIWGKTAENLKPYLVKGKQVCVEGYLKQDRWQDQQTGNNRSRIYIVAENVQLLGGKNENGTDGGNNQNQYQQNNGYSNGGASAATFTPRPQAQQQYQAPTVDEFPEDISF